ncbi:glycoside hydrolase family 88 protein [Mollicutes bacterium LVI A0039]|nr:glycoside hydrolase family 88 protein [Mollicutes bacterium LVI A0039]
MREEILKNVDVVINQLLNLENNHTETKSTEADQKIGKFPRDFGFGFWDWTQGVGLYGLHKYDSEVASKYEDVILQWTKERLSEATPVKNVNTTAPMLTLSKNYAQYKDLCDEWVDWVMNDLNRTKEGAIQHVTSNIDGTGVWLNDGEVWIDTIFMTVLFLNQMAINLDNQEMHEEATFQVLEHIKLLYCKESKLFYHGYNFNGEHNFGGVHWCRGNGWFTLGMIDYLEQEQSNSHTATYRFIAEVYKNQVERLLSLQTESGLWTTVLDNPNSYAEVSGSSAICAGILKGIRLGFIDTKHTADLLRTIEAIMSNINDNGVVENVSAGTAMGEGEEHYINIITAPMAYGQSLAAIAMLEALNHI